MNYLRLLFTIIFLSASIVSTNAVTIHTIGDSTMAEYDENTSEIRGWAMMFKQFIKEGVKVNNRAKSGASSKSFYLEAPYWTTVKKQIQPGDYVFIQFAHNDEKNNGLDGDTVRATTDPAADYRGTTAQGTYKKYLRAYVDETRALGATPVLLTSMCRKYFSGGKITRIGRHDLGEKFGAGEDNHNYDYAYAMKQVAEEMKVQLIDLTTKTKELFEAYGDAACTALLFVSSDGTHPSAMGGTMVARLCAQAMVNQNILDEYVNTASDLLINPTEADFGKAYVGQTLTKEFSVSGFDLSPASGSFTISASEGFTIATSKTGVFSSSITLTYRNGNLDFSRFYVKTTLAAAGSLTGMLTFSNGTISKTLQLNANGIHLSGGTEVKLIWPLASNAEYVLEGPATAIEESWKGMQIQNYASPNAAAVWPAGSGYDATRKTQRNVIEGNAWPAGEIDEVSTRYIQFGITPNKGTELNIDSIGLYICGAGGNGMRSRISFSTDNFANRTIVGEFPSMVANTLYAVSSIPVVKLSEGDTLLLRVYPWYSGAATGKTICLADVCLHGMATTANTVSEQTKSTNITWSFRNNELYISWSKGVSSIQAYNLAGKKLRCDIQVNGTSARVSLPTIRGTYFVEIINDNQRKVIKHQVK